MIKVKAWAVKTLWIVGHPAAFVALMIFLFVWQKTEKMSTELAVCMAVLLLAALAFRIVVFTIARFRKVAAGEVVERMLTPTVSNAVPKAGALEKFRA